MSWPNHPENVPLLMAGWKLASVLASGCTIVVRLTEYTPLTALRLAELCQRAGPPSGVLNVVTGDGAAGAALVEQPGVDQVAFTGSTVTANAIARAAVGNLKRDPGTRG